MVTVTPGCEGTLSAAAFQHSPPQLACRPSVYHRCPMQCSRQLRQQELTPTAAATPTAPAASAAGRCGCTCCGTTCCTCCCCCATALAPGCTAAPALCAAEPARSTWGSHQECSLQGGPEHEAQAAGAEEAAAASGCCRRRWGSRCGLPVAPADLRRAVWMHCREAQAALSRRVKRSATPRQLWWAPPGSGHRFRLLGAARADSGGRACCLAQLPGASLSWYPPGASCRPPPTVRAACRQQRGCGQRQTRPGLHLPPAQQQSANSSVAAARAALHMLLASVVVWLRARATAARSRQAGGPAAARAAAQGRSPDPRSHSPLLRRPAPVYALSDSYMRVTLLCGGFIVPSRRLGFGCPAPLVPRPWVCLQRLWLRSLTSTTQRAGAAGPQGASVLAAHVPVGAGRHRCASGSAHPCHV